MIPKTEITLEEIQNFEGKYPKQLWYLFTIEMWERFCFYGMRGVLAFFMVDQLGFLDGKASLQYGAIQAFVYAFTFIGGIVADKILGFKKSLLFGGIIMILGNLLIAVSPKEFFYYGITLSIIGTGFFKPNISSMVGELYHKTDGRRDAGYGMFYAGINIGGMLGGAIPIYLGKNYSWSLCFLSSAIVMAIGVITFLATKKHLAPIGNSPLEKISIIKQNSYEIAVYIGSLILIPLIYIMVKNANFTEYFMYAIGIIAVGYFLFEWLKIKDVKQKYELLVAFGFIFSYFIFITISEQSGGSLSLFAKDNLSHKLLFFTIDPNVVNNSINSLFVIVFSPMIGLLWIFLYQRKIEPSTTMKFGLAFLFLSAGFFVFYSTRFFVDDKGLSSLTIFAFGYLLYTFGELCIGPIGMAVITKLSPKKMFGMMMGLWFLSNAFGQFAAGKLGSAMSSANTGTTLVSKLIAYTDGYYHLAIYSLIVGVLLVMMIPLKKIVSKIK